VLATAIGFLVIIYTIDPDDDIGIPRKQYRNCHSNGNPMGAVGIPISCSLLMTSDGSTLFTASQLIGR